MKFTVLVRRKLKICLNLLNAAMLWCDLRSYAILDVEQMKSSSYV